VGEAGIGKSRLLDEVAAAAAGLGLAVLRGRAVEGGGAYRAIAEAVWRLDAPAGDAALRPYLPALERLRPDWAAAGPAETSVDPALVLGEGLIRVLPRSGAPTRRGRGSTAVPEKLRSLGVTSREMDVLVLVAEGLTNAEIAARLFLSSRTIDTHVARLLAKTGAGGRAALRTFVSRP
jgi:DNA-binding CsgD family transcriptional regulator